MTTKHFSLLLIAFSLCIIGCGKSDRPEDLPELIPCTITLIQEGQPIDLAMLFFAWIDRAEGEKDWMFSGVTDAKGVCKPMAIGKFPGLVEGTYKVTVTKIWMEPRNDLPPNVQDSLPKALEVNLVHTKYVNASTTPLEITVRKGESNDFTLTLDPPLGGTAIPDPATWPSTKHRK